MERTEVDRKLVGHINPIKVVFNWIFPQRTLRIPFVSEKKA